MKFSSFFNAFALEYCYINSWHCKLREEKSITHKESRTLNNSLANVVRFCLFAFALQKYVYYTMSTPQRVKYIFLKPKAYKNKMVFCHTRKKRDCSRLTEGVPLVLPYCLGDVVWEIFGYRSWRVVVFDVGAPCNGTCGKKNKKQLIFLSFLIQKQHSLKGHT